MRRVNVIATRDPLIKYLLNTLSEDDRAAIEEKLLDEDYREELSKAENKLLVAYITDSLSITNRHLFEQYYLSTEKRKQNLKLLQDYEKSIYEKCIDDSPVHTFFDQFLIRVIPSTPRIVLYGILVLFVSISTFYLWDMYTIKRSEWALVEAYSQERPIEARITGFKYARFIYRRDNQPVPYDKQQLHKAQFYIADKIGDDASIRTINMLGRMKLAERDFDYAIELFNEALLHKETDANTHNNIAAALIAKERNNQSGETTGELYVKASEHLHRAIELDPSLMDAQFNLALCQQYQMLWRLAAESWRKYLEKDLQSQWAEEAKNNLKEIESKINKAGQNREQLIKDFLITVQIKDTEKAWEIYKNSRPSVGSFVLGKLIDNYLMAKAINNSLDAETALQSLIFIGYIEREKTKDEFGLSIAQAYQALPQIQISQLIEARRLYKLTIDLLKKSQFADAITTCQGAINVFNKNGHKAEALLAQSVLGYLHFRVGDTQVGLPLLIRGSDESKSKSYRWLWGSYQNGLYNLNTNLTEYTKARNHNKNYIDNTREIQDTAGLLQGLMAASELNIRLAKYREALIAVIEGLSLAEQLQSPLSNYIDLYMYGAWCYQDLGYLTGAYDFQMEGVKASKELKNLWFTSRYYISLSQILAKQGRYYDAIQNLNNAIELCKLIPDKKLKIETMTKAQLYLGSIFRDAGNLASSDEHLAKAWEILKENSFENVYLSFEIDKGRLQTAISRKDFATAENYLGKVIDQYELHRSKIDDEMSRNALFHREQSIYDIAIEYAFFQLQDERRAFEYSEINRARSLFDIINIPNMQFPDDSNFIIQIPYTVKPLTLEQIQDRIPNKTQLIHYAVTDNNLIIWILTNSDIKSKSASITKNSLDSKVAQYLSQVESNWISPQNIDYKQKAGELYDILIKPVVKDIEYDHEICIIPDKSLNRLPFASLINTDTGRYLIEDLVIYMSPSSNMFIASTERALQKESINEEKLLAIGPAMFNDLPYAESQIRDVSKFYKQANVIVGKDSKKSSIKKLLQQTDIVEFATHYIVNERSPLLSYFPLGEMDTALNNIDNRLEANELYKMDSSRLRLAVLAACQTGPGAYYNGEGPVGLSRVFQTIGVPLVIASLWRVEDYPIMTLMLAFHKHRKINHLSTAKALQAAQIDLIKSSDPRLNMPFHWAAFSLYGGHSIF